MALFIGAYEGQPASVNQEYFTAIKYIPDLFSSSYTYVLVELKMSLSDLGNWYFGNSQTHDMHFGCVQFVQYLHDT